MRDLGLLLNNGAHMSALRRTRIGDFWVDDADTLDKFIANYRDNRNDAEPPADPTL